MAEKALLHGARTNAILGWAVTAVIALAAVESFLSGGYLWGSLALVIVTVVSLPAVVTGEPAAMVAWPLPSVAALAVVAQAMELYPEASGFVAIGSLALIVVVELDIFAGVELSRRFAIVFVVLTTMALQALWTIAQFYSDLWLGTSFIRSQTDLQWDFVLVTAVGVTFGTLAEVYFDQFEPVGSFERPPSGDL